MRYLCLLSNVNARIRTEPPTTTRLSVASSSNECPMCAKIKQSGKFSCCARGGAWFNKCGDADDTKFAHTWAQGIQACTDFPSFMPFESLLKVKFHNVGALHTAQSRKVTQKTAKFYHHGSTIDTVTETIDFDDSDGVTETFVWVCVLCIVSHIQM